MFVIILMTMFLIFIIVQYFLVNGDYWKKRNIKQVNGILWRFMTGKQSMPEIIKDIYDAHPKLKEVGIFIGLSPTLILRDLENIKTVLHGDFQSFHGRGIVTNDRDILTDNLFFTEDFKRWRLQRLKMSPFLTKTQMKNMFYIMERCARDFVKYMGSNLRIIDKPYNVMYTYTSSCITSTVFGIDSETQNTMETPINKIAYESLKTTLIFNLKFAVASVSPKLFKLLNIKTFGRYQQSIIDIVKKTMDKRKIYKKTCHDFIDTCLKFESEGVLKDFVTGYETNADLEFLAAQAFVFFIGGIDTLATALHFTLLELSKHAKILEKVHNEIDKIFVDNMDKITFEDMDKLEYMNMVINEVIRKYPPIGVTQRVCTRDTVLPNGNVKIEKGTKVMIPIFALHRDEKYFPNPEVFDPERFSAENIPNIEKYSYIPFGEGKRICIGIKLAYMQMKVSLALLLRKYTLKEQTSIPNDFEPSFFGIRNEYARYELIPRIYT